MENDVQCLVAVARQHDLWKGNALAIRDAELFRYCVKNEKQGERYWNLDASGKRINQSQVNTKSTNTQIDGREGSDELLGVGSSFNVFSTAVDTSVEARFVGSKMSSGGTAGRSPGAIQVIELYKVPKQFLVDIFAPGAVAASGEFGVYLRSSEVRHPFFAENCGRCFRDSHLGNI